MGVLEVRSRIWILGLAAFILLSFSVYAQGVNAAKFVKYNPDGSQTLQNHVPRVVAKGLAAKIAHANSNQMLDIRIILPPKDQAGLDNLVKQLYDPKSPVFRKFLTHKQVIQQFGANSVDSALVIGQLKSFGLTVNSQSDDGRIIRVAGPVSAVERMFKLNINNYKGADGRQFFSPDANPTIPTQIAGKINAIVGMDNVHKYFSHYFLKKFSGTVKAPAPKTGANLQVKKGVSPAFSGPDGTVAPGDIITAYNLGSVSSTGANQTQGLFELDGFTPGDITQFTNEFNLTQPPITVIPVDGGIALPGQDSLKCFGY